jgi:hypothetical protein
MSDFLRKLDDSSIDEKKKINSSDHFELVYLRHRYFRKSTNPSTERLQQFEEMICNIADKVFYKNTTIFRLVGFEKDDLRNIGRVNTVSFISMGGLEENPPLMEKFLIDHKNKYGNDSIPSKRDVFLRECYNLSKYLNQRLYEIAKFCEVKSANILGDKLKKSFFVGTLEQNPTDDSLLINPESFGFKKITEVEYKNLIKENSPKDKLNFTTSDGMVVRAVHKKPDFSNIEEFYKNSSQNECNLNPEDILIERENLIIKQSLSSKKKT